MEKQAPSAARIATLVVFALSCFAVLLYLWTSFGGAVPLGAKGYRVKAPFDEAAQLADNADVRISGVTVGRVVDSELAGGRTRAEIEIDARYAPIPRGTQAILRVKTLLGETYVELTPGRPATGPMPDGAALPPGQVRPTVELDEVLRSFDRRTRRDLRRFVGGLAGTLEGRGRDASDAVGNLPGFAEDTTSLLAALDGQRGALRRIVRDSGAVLEALGRRHGELRGLVESGETVLATTARRDADLREIVRLLPTTLRELRPTLAEVEALSLQARPLVAELRPAARLLTPGLRSARALAPELAGLLADADRALVAARAGLPAATRVVRSAHPLFRTLEPALAELLPVVDYLGLYRAELVTAVVNLAVSNEATQRQHGGGPPIHYLRALVPGGAESFVLSPERLPSNRPNPYLAPRALDRLAEGLEAFTCEHATETPGEPAPPCREARPLEFRGRRTAFPQIRRDP